MLYDAAYMIAKQIMHITISINGVTSCHCYVILIYNVQYNSLQKFQNKHALYVDNGGADNSDNGYDDAY